MLQGLGYVAGKCDEWGIPLLAMMYPRGKKVRSEYDVDVVKHVVEVQSGEKTKLSKFVLVSN